MLIETHAHSFFTTNNRVGFYSFFIAHIYFDKDIVGVLEEYKPYFIFQLIGLEEEVKTEF